MKTETETGATWPQARDFCSHQKLGRTRRGSPLEPPGAAQPGGHLSFRLTASRAVRESISAVVSPQLVVLCHNSQGNYTEGMGWIQDTRSGVPWLLCYIKPNPLHFG